MLLRLHIENNFSFVLCTAKREAGKSIAKLNFRPFAAVAAVSVDKFNDQQHSLITGTKCHVPLHCASIITITAIDSFSLRLAINAFNFPFEN